MTDTNTAPVLPSSTIRKTEIQVSYSRRRFIYQSAVTAGLAVAASMYFGACGSGPSTNSPVTITVMENLSTIDTGVSQHWITEFQRQHPTIKIERIDYDRTHLSAMLTAGRPPDIALTPGGPDISNMAVRGVAKDLSPYFTQSKLLQENDLQPVCNLYRWDGKEQGKGSRFGMPQDWSQDAMYWIDSSLFQDAKISLPSPEKPLTYDELLELGKRLTTRDGNKIKVYGLGTNWDYEAQLLTLLAQAGYSLYKGGDLSQLDFTQPEVKKIFQWYVDWAQAHIGDSPLDPGSDWSGPLFIAKRYAMVPAGMWFGGYVEGTDQTARERAVLIPAPQWSTTKRVSSCYGGTGMWIPKNAQHADEAWTFFEWYMGGDPAVYRAKSGAGISPLKHLFDEFPLAPAYNKQAYDTQKAELPFYQNLQFTPYATTSAMSQVIDSNMIPVFRGQNSLDSALEQINTSVNALTQQSKDLIG